MSKPGADSRSSVMAVFHFDRDISFLFPYINAVATFAELYEKPNLIRFTFEGIHCVVYPGRCIATPFNSRYEAKMFRDKVMAYLNDIAHKKDDIVPKYKVFKKIPVTDIIRILPKKNCGDCGFSSCMAFAAMLSCQAAKPSLCPHLANPINEQITYPVFDKAGQQVAEVTLDVDPVQDKQTPPARGQGKMPGIPPACNEMTNPVVKPLTKRECEVLKLMGQGLTNREISDMLDISPHTVKSHVIHVFNKLGVNDRTQAAVWAVRHRLI